MRRILVEVLSDTSLNLTGSESSFRTVPNGGVQRACDRVMRRGLSGAGDSMGDDGTYSEPGGV